MTGKKRLISKWVCGIADLDGLREGMESLREGIKQVTEEMASIKEKMKEGFIADSPFFITSKQSLDKFSSVKFFQVINPLSHTNVSNWDFQLFCDSDNDSPLGCPIQFGQSDACHTDGLIKKFRLRDCILACRGVEDEKDLVGCTWTLSADDSFYFLQLFHQVDFSVEPSCGINEDKISVSSLGSMDGVEGDGRGI